MCLSVDCYKMLWNCEDFYQFLLNYGYLDSFIIFLDDFGASLDVRITYFINIYRISLLNVFINEFIFFSFCAFASVDLRGTE
jgi:hypothetical protein